MSLPLFEVTHLRVAAFDAELSVGDVPGPVTDAGEHLSPGWVEVLPDMSFSIDSGEVLALVGESGSGKSLALMGGFSLLAPGTRFLADEPGTRMSSSCLAEKPPSPIRSGHGKNAGNQELQGPSSLTTPMTCGPGSWVPESDSCSRTRSVRGHLIS